MSVILVSSFCHSLTLARYTIIDEADEMVSIDWNEDMAKIMGGGGKFEYFQGMNKH